MDNQNASSDALEEKINAWKAEHGEVAEATLGGARVVFRPPSLAEWERLQNKLAVDKDKSAHMRSLSLQTLLHPAKDEYEALLERFPGFPLKLVDTLGEMVGANADIIVKKG